MHCIDHERSNRVILTVAYTNITRRFEVVLRRAVIFGKRNVDLQEDDLVF